MYYALTKDNTAQPNITHLNDISIINKATEKNRCSNLWKHIRKQNDFSHRAREMG